QFEIQDRETCPPVRELQTDPLPILGRADRTCECRTVARPSFRFKTRVRRKPLKSFLHFSDLPFRHGAARNDKIQKVERVGISDGFVRELSENCQSPRTTPPFITGCRALCGF